MLSRAKTILTGLMGRPSLAATVSEAKGRTPNCGSVSGTRAPKAVDPTTASQTGRDVRKNR